MRNHHKCTTYHANYSVYSQINRTLWLIMAVFLWITEFMSYTLSRVETAMSRVGTAITFLRCQ